MKDSMCSCPHLQFQLPFCPFPFHSWPTTHWFCSQNMLIAFQTQDQVIFRSFHLESASPIPPPHSPPPLHLPRLSFGGRQIKMHAPSTPHPPTQEQAALWCIFRRPWTPLPQHLSPLLPYSYFCNHLHNICYLQ